MSKRYIKAKEKHERDLLYDDLKKWLQENYLDLNMSLKVFPPLGQMRVKFSVGFAICYDEKFILKCPDIRSHLRQQIEGNLRYIVNKIKPHIE